VYSQALYIQYRLLIYLMTSIPSLLNLRFFLTLVHTDVGPRYRINLESMKPERSEDGESGYAASQIFCEGIVHRNRRPITTA